MLTRFVHLACAALAVAACTSPSSTAANGSATSTELRACNPFETAVNDVTLGEIVAVGRDAQGTVHVVDKVDFDHRVFVSGGDVLERKAVVGSGETPDFLSLSCTDDAGPFQIKIETSGGTPTRMAIHRGVLTDTKTFDIDTQGETLEIIDASAIAAMTARDLPKGEKLLYDALTSDGHRVVATSPTHDASYEDYRLFYGTPTDMTERAVRDAIGGGTLFMTFDLDGVWATANFPSQFSGPPNDVAKIRFESGTVMSMTMLDASADPPARSMSYRCH